ncbi:MAG: UbiD family decarboxylase domain-containing protein, partial [Acidobacteriaceae bacterium]
MPCDDLRVWIKLLDKAGELRRIREEVSPNLEIAEFTDRVSKSGSGTNKAGGPALLFENIKGHPGARVLINQFGSARRMKLALGLDPDSGSLDEIANRIRALLEIKSPEGLLEKLKMLPQLAAIGNVFPKTISPKDAPCKEVVLRDNFSLDQFPILQCWPLDGGRFITLPCVITRDPRTGKRNMGMYRMQVYDGQTTGMHWQRQKNAAEHLRERLRAIAPDAAA